jgi:hypothetical protein
MSLERVISGGQSGVDRAALDLAIELGIDAGGWIPRGRLAEDGPLPRRYKMTETPTDDYAQRTKWNVRDSDATLLIFDGELAGGSALTAAFPEQLRRPCFRADLRAKPANEWVDEILAWLERGGFRILNVAGPRSSKDPGIYDKACRVLRPVLISVTGARSGSGGASTCETA